MLQARPQARRVARVLLEYAVAAASCALVALPVVVEQAVERTSFDDLLGTVPVEVSLCHEGRSTLATGVLGDVHYDRTGAFGFGIRAEVTGPPQAGGTLASYADPAFLRANAAFVEDPEQVVSLYADEFADRVTRTVVLASALVGSLGGVAVLALLWLRPSGPGGPAVRHRRTAGGLVILVAATAVSTAGAALLFDRWICNSDEPAAGYPLASVPGLSFAETETLEIARQVGPFIEKNRERARQRATAYVATATASFRAALDRVGDGLVPREGEVVVVAEADPQGSLVGARLRTALLARLQEVLGEDAVAMRTISGDVTSNGTVAEAEFVAAEAAVGGELPTVAVAGDHDSDITHQQLADAGMVLPDREVVEVAGLRVAGAHDVERKALFGALISNDSGLTEEELGALVREEVDGPAIVLLHQPQAVEGYLGVDLSAVRAGGRSLTSPVDDGVPDVPPGTVNIGHLHDADGPWVLWNTDGDEVTWTVVDQLGTSGGVEEHPTFNRFSTPTSEPLKDVSFRLQYVEEATGLQRGFATVSCSTSGDCFVSRRTAVGLPLG